MAETTGGISQADLLSMQKQQGAADDVKVNEDETGELIKVGAEKGVFTAAKIGMLVPVFGWLLQMVMPFNAGKVGLDAGLSSEGFAGKQIRPGGGGAQGGFLAKIAGELIKNSTITDLTAGVGGSADGGGGGSSGDSGGGHHQFDSGSFHGMDSAPIIAAGGGNHFDYSDIPRSALGSLSPDSTPNMGSRGIGAGMELG